MKKSEALKTLGLQEGATEEEIKKAHRKLAIASHPDKFGQDAEARAKAEEKMKLINEARDVLLNHSWEPEYSTAGTPYGAPFSYNPYTAARPQGGQAPQGNPFEGWPFAESFVWTTWDENGNKTTYTSTSGNPFTGSPFGAGPFSWADPFASAGAGQAGGAHRSSEAGSASGNASQQQARSPFSASSNPFAGSPFSSVFSQFFGEEPTKEQLLREAKADLKFDLELIAVKAVILALAFLTGAPATGLYLYTIISIGQGIWKRLNFLSLVFVVPFAMLAVIFTPGGNATIGIIALAVFVCAVVFDVVNIVRHAKRIAELKRK